MKLSAERIVENYNVYQELVTTYVGDSRRDSIKGFLTELEDRIVLYPCATTTRFDYCYPGGWVKRTLDVFNNCKILLGAWKQAGMVEDAFSEEELYTSALLFDIGRLGSKEHPWMVESTNQWRKENLGELYEFNSNLPNMHVPERSLYHLQSISFKLTTNEMMAIRYHMGLYDDSNAPYFKMMATEAKPRNSMVYILVQAIEMAGRLEYEQQRVVQPKDKKVVTNPHSNKRKTLLDD